MLSVIYANWHYAEYCCAECYYTDCHNASFVILSFMVPLFLPHPLLQRKNVYNIQTWTETDLMYANCTGPSTEAVSCDCPPGLA
jgi:hypothetical protein